MQTRTRGRVHKILAVEENEKGWLYFNLSTLQDGRFTVHYEGTNLKRLNENIAEVGLSQIIMDPSMSTKNARIVEGIHREHLQS